MTTWLSAIAAHKCRAPYKSHKPYTPRFASISLLWYFQATLCAFGISHSAVLVHCQPLPFWACQRALTASQLSLASWLQCFSVPFLAVRWLLVLSFFLQLCRWLWVGLSALWLSARRPPFYVGRVLLQCSTWYECWQVSVFASTVFTCRSCLLSTFVIVFAFYVKLWLFVLVASASCLFVCLHTCSATTSVDVIFYQP